MKKDNQKTNVIFKITPENGEVIALFPAISEGWGKIGSYMHVGQHAPAEYELTVFWKDASPKQFTPLKEELESIGYDLHILNTKYFASGEQVIVNTGGEDTPATIAPNDPNKMPFLWTIREYLCIFDNGTAQYIPERFIEKVPAKVDSPKKEYKHIFENDIRESVIKVFNVWVPDLAKREELLLLFENVSPTYSDNRGVMTEHIYPVTFEDQFEHGSTELAKRMQQFIQDNREVIDEILHACEVNDCGYFRFIQY